ncbi:MAG: HPP family protein [Sporomusaceae bacterium]|nr:HPP family protein [Sporomusaceae bacterium]
MSSGTTSPIKDYFKKWYGKTRTTMRVPGISSLLWTFIAGFCGIWLISYFSLQAQLFPLFAPLGASAVLLYGASSAPFSQPRNLLGGHIISALTGVVYWHLLGDTGLAVALAVASAIILMLLTRTVHPPAGATALLGVTVSNGSFLWVLTPVAVSACILLLVALVINNLDKQKSYPEFWF